MGAYAPPAISAQGLTIPLLAALQNFLQQSFLGIYGQAIVLDNSNSDTELLGVVATAYADVNSLLQMVFNNESITFAIGAGLDNIGANLGIPRQVATYSTAQVTLAGTAGTVITNGEVSDNVFGYTWTLPPSVTIGSGGTVVVTATCTTIGAVSVPIASIVNIENPTSGWNSVTNAAASVPGDPVESDSQYRTRLSISQELPSLTPLEATLAAILAVEGVTAATVLENYTSSTDSLGNPAHSISAVVQGGTEAAVAQAIYGNKGIGADTNSASGGGTPVTVDVTGVSGIVIPINYTIPAQVSIYVSLEVHVFPGATFAVIEAAIQAAIVAYIESLPLASPGTASTTTLPTISFGELVAAANSPNLDGPPTYSVRAANFFFGTASSPSTNTDITLAFYQQAVSATGNIVVTSV
jgi:uncharacterized phage protein gp47/JayE